MPIFDSRKRQGRILVVLAFVVLLLGLFGGSALFLTRTSFEPLLHLWTPTRFAAAKALFTCSGVFVAGRDPEAILREELQGTLPGMHETEPAVIDRKNEVVRVAPRPGQTPRLAVHRQGMGCTLLPTGSTLADARALPTVAWKRRPGTEGIPWPDGDGIDPPPPNLGVDQARLRPVVEAAFDGTYAAGTETIGVAVVYRDHLIAEAYRPGFDEHTQYRTWSAAKSIASALVGIAVGEGWLALDAPAPIPEWSDPDDPRRRITVEHLLHMSSGLAEDGIHAFEVYFGDGNVARQLAEAEADVAPGTRWAYANRDTLALMRAIRHALGDDRRYLELPRRALFDRIGMHHTIAETDHRGNFILSSQVYTTARDLARFGLLYLHDGVWNGERILPEGWVDYTRRPAPSRPRGLAALVEYGIAGFLGYGAQFWLYEDVPFFVDDAYSAIGHRGQYVTIVPSHDLVVVRTGLDPEDESALWRQDRFIDALIGVLG